ncbi:MAG: hypothetical protein GF353_20280 [Candidatus Lokiarchaeota archaeon]|nr:hypothetical protein [Candidatus Lokiarchaeota archaeon]
MSIICIAAIGSLAYFYYFSQLTTGSSDDDDDDDDNGQLSTSLIIDHTCLKLNQIPDSVIDTIQSDVKLHYAHTSHGGQITTGLSRVESADSKYDHSRAASSLPNTEGALCIFDGQESDTYISPDECWETAGGVQDTRDVINNNPTITVSMWCWCRQVNTYSTAQIETYLQTLDDLETEYRNAGRDIRFVYMTGNADRGHYPEGTPAESGNENPSEGYHRYLNNEIIREFCRDNNKILLDFADIECWLYDGSGNPSDQATYNYDPGTGSETVPKRHWQYSNVSQSAHTTNENCENKAKAVWWMLARISGWNPS